MKLPETFEEVLANRKIWAEFLMQPEREKAHDLLELSVNRDARCCLGHACYVFREDTGVSESGNVWYGNDRNFGYPSQNIVAMLGLYDRFGSVVSGCLSYTNKEGVHRVSTLHEGSKFPSLSSLNDDTKATPQDIGAYLLKALHGGEDTPFRDEKHWSRNHAA